MKQRTYQLDESFYTDILHEFVQTESFKKFMSIGQNWIWFAEKLKACAKEGNDIIFFPTTFRAWIEELTGELPEAINEQ